MATNNFTSGGSYVGNAELQYPLLSRYIYCFTLILKLSLTRRVDNVPSLPKTLSTKLNIGHLIGFVWAALQMTTVVSTCSAGFAIAKYWKGCGLSVKHSQLGTVRWSCVFRSAELASAMACDGQQQQRRFVGPRAGESIEKQLT